MSDSVEMMGNYGYYIDDSNIISFQLGTNPTAGRIAFELMKPGSFNPAVGLVPN